MLVIIPLTAGEWWNYTLADCDREEMHRNNTAFYFFCSGCRFRTLLNFMLMITA